MLSGTCLSVDLVLKILQKFRVGSEAADGALHVLAHGGAGLETGVEHEKPLEGLHRHLQQKSRWGV